MQAIPNRISYFDNQSFDMYSIFTPTTSVQDPITSDAPKTFMLFHNYPNPFNPSTTIRYRLPVGGKVTLKVFDLLGRQTLTLEDENEREAGYYEEVINLSSMASGVYFYRIAVSGEQKFAATQKMLLVK